MLLVQSIARGYLARKHAQEARKVRAATTIQRGWRGHKQRHSFNAIRNSVVLAQAAAKGFLRRGEIVDALVRSAVVLIQRVWRSRRQMKSWRQYQRKVVIIQRITPLLPGCCQSLPARISHGPLSNPRAFDAMSAACCHRQGGS
jgi:myosin-5